MDMKDNNDDILLRDFFSQASQTEIADDGFSNRVMSRIDPISLRRSRIASRVWTAACWVAAILLMPWAEMANQAKSAIMAFICRFPMIAENAILNVCHDPAAMTYIASAPIAATSAVVVWCLVRYRNTF